MADINKIKKLREMTNASLMDVKSALDNTDNDLDKAVIWLRENGILKAAKKADRIAAEGIIKIVENENGIAILEFNSETDFVSANKIFLNSVEKLALKILENKISNFEKINDIKIDGLKFDDFLKNLTAIIGEKIVLRRFYFFDAKNNEKLDYSFYLHSNHKIGVITIGEGLSRDILKDLAMHIAAMNPEYLTLNDVPEERKTQEMQVAKKELSESLKGKPENIQEKILKGKVEKSLAEFVLLEQTFVKDNSKKINDLLFKGKLINFVYYKVGDGIEKKVENFAEEVSKQLNKK